MVKKIKADNNLLNSRFQYWLKYSPIVFFSFKFHKNLEISFISDNIKNILGYEPNEFINNSQFWFDCVHPIDLPHIFTQLPILLEKGSIVTEYRFKNKKGEYKWLYDEKRVICDKNGKLLEIIGFWIDITERKQLEQKLKESEEKDRDIIESMMEGYYEVDHKGNFTFCSKRMCEYLGYSRDELIGVNFRKLVTKKNVLNVYNKFNSVYNREVSRALFDIEIVKSNDNIAIVENSVYLKYNSDGKRIGFYGLARDITENRMAEQKLKESEVKYRNITEQSLLGVAIIQDNVFKYINQRYAEIGGYTVEEMLNWQPGEFIKIVYPDDQEMVMTQSTKMHRRDKDVINQYLFRGIAKTGEVIWLELYSKSIMYEGRPAVLITIIDITERKQAVQRLKESQMKYKSLVETSPNAILLVDLNGFIVDCNKAAEINFHLERSNIIHKNFFNFFSSSNEKKIALVKDLLRIIKSHSNKPFEIEYVNKNGEKKWLNLYFSQLNIKSKTYIIFEVIDFTNIKKLEEIIKEENRKLKKSEKNYRSAYEVAKLYKDIFAHDINNILNNILMSSNLSYIYLNNPENHDKIIECLNIINDQVKNGANLISNVRKLSELDESKIPIQPTEVNNQLNESIASIKKAFQDRNINIQVESFIKELYIQANNLLKDVFENILNNAVKYNNGSLTEIFVKISKEEKLRKNYIKFEFSDNGIGISDTQKEFIFKKGYKEHKGGKGMGFGLTLVKKIIESYNGQIWVEDRVNGDYTKGSNFVLLIPEIKKK